MLALTKLAELTESMRLTKLTTSYDVDEVTVDDVDIDTMKCVKLTMLTELVMLTTLTKLMLTIDVSR